MAKWAHTDLLDNGPAYLRANATRWLLVKDYAAGDSYATVQGNKLAEATISTADFTLASSGNNRQLTLAAKAGITASTSGTGNLHFVLTDGTSKVLYAVDETSDAAIANGAVLNFPALTLLANQPT